MQSRMHPHTNPRVQRLTRGPELERVRLKGKRFRGASIEARSTASPFAFPRVGLIVPKYGHTAVDRNRLKRRLRELVRMEVLPVLHPVDLVFRAAPSAYRLSFESLRQEILSLVRRMMQN